MFLIFFDTPWWNDLIRIPNYEAIFCIIIQKQLIKLKVTKNIASELKLCQIILVLTCLQYELNVELSSEQWNPCFCSLCQTFIKSMSLQTCHVEVTECLLLLDKEMFLSVQLVDVIEFYLDVSLFSNFFNFLPQHRFITNIPLASACLQRQFMALFLAFP